MTSSLKIYLDFYSVEYTMAPLPAGRVYHFLHPSSQTSLLCVIRSVELFAGKLMNY